ncbi:MAG TPA: DUF2213 domain-containing protein [Novosphingobium sp.]|nr:DUF2213 domain-containing protein [Novosphingobium sp.]
MTTILLAMDRATVRRRDVNGYMHVETSNISKANVCPYYGSEIPEWQMLGLEADKLYQLYRCPDELARGAETFNNVPLLSQHVPVIPEDGLPEDLIIGSTGTDAMFDGTYLRNSLVVWSALYQEAIEDGRQRELSCGYRYRADMTAGQSPEGLRYDGVMRDIMGNHVALVIEGRAGPDVVVGDDVMKLKSRTALMISGALQSHIRPLLAADAKVDLAPVLIACDAASLAKDGSAKKLADKVAALVTPHLAADKALDPNVLAAAIGAVTPLALDEDKIAEDDDEEDDDKHAEDEDPEAKESEDEDDDKDCVKGMDAASVRKLIADAEKRGARRVAAMDQAKADVAPLVGEVVGMDSAEAVYRFALDSAGYEKSATDKAPLATLKAMVKREAERKSVPMAQDRRIPATGSKLAAIVGDLPTMIRS